RILHASTASRVHEMLKMRFFDILIASIFLIIACPFFIILSILIWTSGSKPFFKHKRVGLNGKEFYCLKFTSMKGLNEIEEAEQERVIFELDHFGKVNNDPRVTKIGNFIRKTSIDETPQFFNVLKGDMSLIGPRPITKAEMKIYGTKIKSYLSVKPGITGLWQISGRSNTTYSRRVAIDHYYALKRTRRMKIMIMMKTVYVVLFMKGAQ
ncbi:sugar transferase, partial [Klebsiella pneumoniae]